VAVFHLHGEPDGDTYLRAVDLPAEETSAGKVRHISDIPVSSAGIGAFVGRKPDVGMHHAPRRALLVVLDGALEILTSLEQREVLVPGDVLFADDVGSKGHISRDVGETALSIMSVGVEDSWSPPT
jgi:hypothetical protein